MFMTGGDRSWISEDVLGRPAGARSQYDRECEDDSLVGRLGEVGLSRLLRSSSMVRDRNGRVCLRKQRSASGLANRHDGRVL